MNSFIQNNSFALPARHINDRILGGFKGTSSCEHRLSKIWEQLGPFETRTNGKIHCHVSVLA